MTRLLVTSLVNRISARRREIAVGGLAIALGFVMLPEAFLNFFVYDDEGTHLSNISLALHGSVYPHSDTEYGPNQFTFGAAIFSVLRIGVTHDAGRLVTVGAWILATAIGALIILRVTNSGGAALAAVPLGMTSLVSLLAEPLQPAYLIQPLVAGLVLVLAQPRHRERQMFVAGALLTSIGLIKINIGAFAVLGVLGAGLLVRAPTWPRSRGLAFGVLAMPVVLMLSRLSLLWVDEYAMILILAAATVAAAAPRVRRPPELHLAAKPLLLGAIAAGIVEGALAMLRGDAVSDIVSGVLIRPLDQVKGLMIPLATPNTDTVIAVVIAAVVTVGLRRAARNPGHWIICEPWARFGCGLTAIAWTINLLNWSPNSLWSPIAGVGCAALILIPGREVECASSRGRIVLACLTVTLAFQGYPTAGSQVRFGGVFSVLCGIIVLDDARILIKAQTVIRHTRVWILIALFGSSAGTAVGAAPGAWQTYAHRGTLSLPGSAMMRLDADQTRTIVATVDALRNQCRGLVTAVSSGERNEF